MTESLQDASTTDLLRRIEELEQSCRESEGRFRALAEGSPELKRLEEQLAQARKLEAVGILAGVVAHDLNNLLTPVLGYATFLKRDLGPDHHSAQGVAAIERSAVRAASMISQLLAYSREIKHVNVPVDIKVLVDDCSASLKSRISDAVSLLVQCPPGAAITPGDPRQLAQVLEIVVGNALDSMAYGGTLAIGLELRALDQEFCRHHPALSPGPHFCLSVSDTGCGIPAETIPRIFEPFFSTKSPAPGRGMGLALVYSILKSHAAAVTVESAVGAGTTLRIYLPALQSSQPASL